MVSQDVYVVEIIEQYNDDDPSSFADFDVNTVLFKDYDDACKYLKLLKQTWIEDNIDPEDIYDFSNEIGIQPSEVFNYGFYKQAGIEEKELN